MRCGCAAGRSPASSRRGPRADAAPEPRQEDALAGQPRQEVVELSELDLQAPLPRARPAREDVEDELRAVEGLPPHRALQVPLLGGGEVVVEETASAPLASLSSRTSSTLPADQVAGSRRDRSCTSVPTTRAPALRASCTSSSSEDSVRRAVAPASASPTSSAVSPRRAIAAQRGYGRGLEATGSLTRVIPAFRTRWCRSPSRTFRNAPGR